MEAMIHRQSCFSLTTILLVAALITCLTSCSSNGKQWDPEDYTVKSGDTVYSIAWRYELDPEEFAKWNNLARSGLIKPGQRLHTRMPANFKTSRSQTSSSQISRNQSEYRASDIAYVPSSGAAKSKRSVTVNPQQKWVKAKKGDTLYAISKQHGVSIGRLAQLNQLKKPYVIQPGQTIFLKPLTPPVKKTAPSSTKTAVNKTQTVQSSTISWPKTVRWQRPAKGKVVKKFNRRQNDAKGIDIAGKLGDTIVASADGKVVYSGNGLISYGNLIIIKHNKTYLSAYAYNRKLLVKEGDAVKTGQKIAEMGRKDKLSPRLHFEIRKNGKPVDPLKYLPW
jgi:lipoprotein NlpD